MNRQWDTQLTVKAIFDHPSVQEQVRLLQSKAAKQRVQWFSNPGSIPITPMQFATFGPDRSASAWQYINIEKRNRFDQELIRAVVFKLIDDHETLRTSFHCDGKTLQQTTQLPNKEGSFAFLDLSKELDQDNKKAQIIDQLVQSRPIEDSVLVRFTLLRMSMHDELLIVVHAAIIDSEGWKILISDLMELYRQMVADRPAHLSVQKNSFYQWAELLQQKMQSENWDRDEAYWHEILEGRFCIPLFQQRQVSSANFQDPKDLATITVELNKRYTQLLREEANASFNTRPEDLLLAALSVAHAPHTDEDRLLILFEGAERIALQSFPQPHRTIGRFTTPFPVLLPVEDELDMALRIKKVKEHLRRVPNRGGTYPQCSSAVVKFPLAFYFLGEWQKTDNDDQFTLHFGESRLFSPLIHDHHQPLYLVAVIIDEKLTFSLHFAAQLYNTSQLTEWAENLKNTLREILDYCINRTTRERTPSDFEYKELSIDDLAKLTAFFE
jgi:bacitracin synthase 3